MSSKRRMTRSTSTVDETRAVPEVESTGASILSRASSTSVLGGEFNASQRDHNRNTIIINNHIGGSDSDTTRSTLAVSNSITSGLVGDPPHASISSSVRDLPYSSTSSASNHEQNSLEEFSVSTDSGLGSSEVCSETESADSPPDEEEILVEEEPSNVIYERHMYLKKHGSPLWIPQPNMRLSRSYRRQGVSIGDVGIFTSDGGFDFLFNVCLPAGHPNNPNELPEGFSCFLLRPSDVSEFHAHSSHSHLASPSVKKRDRAMFQCSGSDGAILAMPQGAYHEDLKNIMTFREYVLIHAESWYVHAKGPCGRQVGNGELHVVTGCDKTTSWGIATYSHLQSKGSEDNVSLLKFNPVCNERQARHSSYTTYEWDYEGVVLEAKFGPEEDELMNLGVNGSVPPRNQCTFIRSLTPAVCVDDWERLELKVASLVKDQASERSRKGTFPSVSGAISSLSSRIGFLWRGHSRGGSSEVTDSMTPAQTTATHPATNVINMMLRKCPKAKVVVVHDSDWCSVIRDSDDDWTCTVQDLPQRIQEAFHIVEDKNGIVYLEEKARLSQDFSTSSDVSVKLEVEDPPLFEDQKPGPSQLFGSFETTPSDMEVDSPRSFKKLVDGDEDIKPTNTYLDFGEGDGNDLGGQNFLLLEDRKSWPSKLIDCFEISPSDTKDDYLSAKKKIADWDDIKPNKYHVSSEDDEDHFGDEDDLKPDAAFLEFILRRIQQMKHDNKEPSLFPLSLKTFPDECGDPVSAGRSERDTSHEESPWSDAFFDYISLQIQKLKNNSSSKESFSLPAGDCDGDNKSNQQHGSNKRPFKLETDDLDNQHRVLLHAIIRIILRMKNDDNDLKGSSPPQLMKQSTDDRDDNAKPDLLDASAKANLESLKGKLIHRDTQVNVHALSNDEDYLMSDATSEPTSQTYGRQTASGGGVMPLTGDLSGSSGPCTSPLVRELLGKPIGRYHVPVGDLSPEVNSHLQYLVQSLPGSLSRSVPRYPPSSGPRFNAAREQRAFTSDQQYYPRDRGRGTPYGRPPYSHMGTDSIADYGHPMPLNRNRSGLANTFHSPPNWKRPKYSYPGLDSPSRRPRQPSEEYGARRELHQRWDKEPDPTSLESATQVQPHPSIRGYYRHNPMLESYSRYDLRPIPSQYKRQPDARYIQPYHARGHHSNNHVAGGRAGRKTQPVPGLQAGNPMGRQRRCVSESAAPCPASMNNLVQRIPSTVSLQNQSERGDRTPNANSCGTASFEDMEIRSGMEELREPSPHHSEVEDPQIWEDDYGKADEVQQPMSIPDDGAANIEGASNGKPSSPRTQSRAQTPSDLTFNPWAY